MVRTILILGSFVAAALLLAFALLLVGCGGATKLSPKQYAWGTAYDPPFDTTQTQNRRVWLAVEGQDSCRAVVSILDSIGQPVRHFLDSLLRQGYYNFYWDGLDDVGKRAPAGAYEYRSNDCLGSRTGKLRVEYGPYGLTSTLEAAHLADSGWIGFSLPEDSLTVSLDILDRTGRVVLGLIADSIMTAGSHRRLIMRPERYVGGIKAIVRLKVKTDVLYERIWVKP
jgi:hypothetical protein